MEQAVGLDNFAYKLVPITAEDDPRLADINLCGGMFSGNGARGSFRGKVYGDMVESITGVSLYQSVISTGDVQTVAEELKAWLNANPGDWASEVPSPIDQQPTAARTSRPCRSFSKQQAIGAGSSRDGGSDHQSRQLITTR
jgi:hypothetical protein